jgi:hypothetical protein
MRFSTTGLGIARTQQVPHQYNTANARPKKPDRKTAKRPSFSWVGKKRLFAHAATLGVATCNDDRPELRYMVRTPKNCALSMSIGPKSLRALKRMGNDQVVRISGIAPILLPQKAFGSSQ